MAFVSRQLLGIASGSVGDLVYKNRRGKSFVAPKPGRYKKTKSPDLIRNRTKFGIASKFASVINETEFLVPIWKLTKLPGKSAYTRILKHIYTKCENSFIHSRASITPEGYDLQNVRFNIDDDSMEIIFNVKKDVADIFTPPFVVVAIVYMYQPIEKETPENRESFLIFQQELVGGNFADDEENALPLLIDEGTFKILNDYNKVIIFFTIISIENVNKETVYTNGTGHRFKGFEFFDAELMAMRDLRPKKPPVSDEPVNIFRKR